jgi:hypothetical protein
MAKKIAAAAAADESSEEGNGRKNTCGKNYITINIFAHLSIISRQSARNTQKEKADDDGGDGVGVRMKEHV